MELKNQSILIFSTEPWGEMWFSKHNWANELSKNNQVYFFNSPTKWSLKDLFKTEIKVNNYSSSLHIIDYNNRIPFTRVDLLCSLNEYILAKSFNKFFKSNNISKPIYWSFDPYRFSKPSLFNPLISLFFRVDKFFLLKRELELLANIDALIVTAKELLIGTSAKKSLVLSHGISEDEFNPTSEKIKYESGYFLYVGQIDHRIDLDLLERMLNEFPHDRFLFIGKVVDIQNEHFKALFLNNKYNNLIIHGVEHFKKLKNYIYHAKACLVPMDLKIHGNAVHHHKSLQYLALGKPVISPIFNDEINKDDIILGYSNADIAIEHLKSLDQLETPELINKRINFAHQFLYTNLIKKVEEFLS